MKGALSKFRAADVSIIKDDAMRAKAQKLQAKQKGFTLLELLIVITLLATLATAALVAYNGIGETASDTAAANNLLAAQSALNNYRAIESGYPNQWDNLANVDGDDLTDASGAVVANTNGELLAPETLAFFGQWEPSVEVGDNVLRRVAIALNAVGIDELQQIDVNGVIPAGIIPNLVFNESGGHTASELEFEVEGAGNVEVEWAETEITAGTSIAFSIIPSHGVDDTGTSLGCVADGVQISDSRFNRNATDFPAPTDSSVLNLINDAISQGECTLVLALGYGKDVPGTTLGSKVEIAQVPTLGTDNVNPANHYARAIALFQVASDTSENGIIEPNEVFKKARLIGIVDPEGRMIDQVLFGANQEG